MPALSDLQARRIAPGAKPIRDGIVTGLWLEPAAVKGRGKWILRFVSPETGKRRDMGLGTYPETTIVAARKEATTARNLIASGKDPITERNAARAAQKATASMPTFEQASRKLHEELKPGWRNAKHVSQWINTLQQYAFPSIGKRKVDELTPADFAGVLRAIWLAKPETGSRVRQRCHAVMKWCWAQGMIASNPVDMVDHLLAQQPKVRVRVAHQPSMPWRDVPAFVLASLRGGRSNPTRALLEFVILTAARSGEARAMTWAEVDLEAGVWTVPADRMKARTAHRVPLPARAVEILKAQRRMHPDSALAFPSPRGKLLTDMVLTSFLRKHKAPSSTPGRFATAHGFRSSFRDWCSEQGYARDLAERALAHTIRNQAEAAYHRTDLLDQRRPMMEAWAQFVCGGGIKDRPLAAE